MTDLRLRRRGRLRLAAATFVPIVLTTPVGLPGGGAVARAADNVEQRQQYVQPMQRELQQFKRAAPPSPAAAAPTGLNCAQIADGTLRLACEQKVQALRRPTAIVVSGGVSLGSHQGGMLHYLSQFLRAYREHVRAELGDSSGAGPTGGLSVATGASAGSINAFLAAMTSCRDEVIDPPQSLFFTTWIPVGMSELIKQSDVSSSAVLSRAPIDAAICRVRRLWNDTPKGCEPAVVGATPAPVTGAWSEAPCAGRVAFDVTRLKAREIPLTNGGGSSEPLTIKRQTEQFLLRYEKPAGRVPPVFYPVLPPDDKALGDLYPVLGDRGYNDPIALDHVFALLKASSSFPVAFEPVPVPHWLPRGDGTAPAAGVAADTTSRFIDGGVFDNTPLGIAMTLSEWMGQDPYLVFVEPDAIGWKNPERKPGPTSHPNQTVFGIYGDFVSDFIAVSRQAEILSALARKPSIRQTLQVPPRKLPSASGHVLNFLGFFERDFRRFDFYLGMTDAWDYLRRVSSASGASGVGNNRQYAVMKEANRLPRTTDPVFACFTALRQKEPDNFATETPPDPGAVPECARVARDDANLLAIYRAVRDLRRYLQRDGSNHADEQQQFFAALSNHHVAFKDLQGGGDPLTAGQAVAKVRDDMQLLVHMLGAQQPGAVARKAASVVGKAAANELQYRTPRHTLELWGAVNSSGVGMDYLLSARSGLRAQLGVSLEPWQRRRVDPAPDAPAKWTGRWGARLALGYEHAFSNRWQLSFTAGGDAHSITRNHDGLLSVFPDEQLLWRYGAVGMLRVTLYQRLSFGLNYVRWLDACARNTATNCTVAPESGMASLTLGWRLLDLFLSR